MLQLRQISLIQFKNYGSQTFSFDCPVIAISGKNGVGKTNLLDAIYYLSFTKSYFGTGDQMQVKMGTYGFRLSGTFSLDEKHMNVDVILRETGKKEISCNGAPYEKFSEHIGRFPVVMIAPDDIELINGTADIRRKFIDTILCQTDEGYMQTLIRYNKFLQQRNSYLKQAAVHKKRDNDLLETIDEQLANTGTYLYEKRKAFMPAFRDHILNFYKDVAGKDESIDVQYESQLHGQNLIMLLQDSREKDHITQRTQFGIHKDNLALLLDDQIFKTRGSQGQKKSLLFSLKLAEAITLEKTKSFSPILLLDDVFEKLDAGRMENLLEYICHRIKAQIFLTDTHPQRMRDIFEKLGKEIKEINI